MTRFLMKNYNMILTDMKQQKKSTLTSGKIGKYEYLTSEEILTSDKRTAIEQAKFTYSPLGKALEKIRRKSIEDYR